MCRACAEIFRRLEFNKTSFNEPRLVDGSRTHTRCRPTFYQKEPSVEGLPRFGKNGDRLVPRMYLTFVRATMYHGNPTRLTDQLT